MRFLLVFALLACRSMQQLSSSPEDATAASETPARGGYPPTDESADDRSMTIRPMATLQPALQTGQTQAPASTGQASLTKLQLLRRLSELVELRTSNRLLLLLTERLEKFFETNQPLLELASTLLQRVRVSTGLERLFLLTAENLNLLLNYLANSLTLRRQKALAEKDDAEDPAGAGAAPATNRARTGTSGASSLDAGLDGGLDGFVDAFPGLPTSVELQPLQEHLRSKRFLFYGDVIKMKVHKFNTLIAFKKWKVEQLIKFKVWLLVILGRLKQALFGKQIIRDEDVYLLVKLFYPEVYAAMH